MRRRKNARHGLGVRRLCRCGGCNCSKCHFTSASHERFERNTSISYCLCTHRTLEVDMHFLLPRQHGLSTDRDN